MNIHHRPRNLLGLALASLLLIPLIVLNIAVHEKTQLLRVFSNVGNVRLILFFAGWSILNFVLIARARWAGFWSFGMMAGVLLYGNVYFLFVTKNYGLAFFAMGLLILTIFHGINLFQTLSLVFFDTGRKWFEEFPRFVPNITVTAKRGEQQASLRLSALSTDGCFVYAQDSVFQPDSILLKLDRISEQEVECKVELVTRTSDQKGLGLMFLVENQDQWTDLNEFIDRVRSYGYA